MSLFENLNSNPQTPQNQRQMLNELKKNPCEMLKQRGLNIPSGMNNPQQIVQHLVQSGQVGNQRVQMLMQMLRR